VTSTQPVPNAPTDQALFNDADPTHAYYRLFFALQRVARTIMPDIERAFRNEGIADPIWYEILLAAKESGADGVQMMTLQRRLFVQQYSLSRHIPRMERVGLIRTVPVQGAGRGKTVQRHGAQLGCSGACGQFTATGSRPPLPTVWPAPRPMRR
jgi:hypothetical protein